MEQPKISYATERKKYYRRRHYHVCVLSTTETREREKDWNESTCKANVWATFYAADDSARSASENRQSNDVNKYSSSIRPLPNPAAPPHTHSVNRKNRQRRKWIKIKAKLLLFACRSFYSSMACEYFKHIRMGESGVCVCVCCEWCERCVNVVANAEFVIDGDRKNRPEKKKNNKNLYFSFSNSVVGKRWCVQRTQFCCCSHCTQFNIKCRFSLSFV